MHSEKQIPIWFFIGLVLAVYGVLILASGVYGALHPPPLDQRVKLWNLHADIWWGVLLLIVGVIYISVFRPGKAPPST